MKLKNMLTVLSACCMMLAATGCGAGGSEVVLFSEEAYAYDVVCSVQASQQEAEAISMLTNEMEELCGSSPELVYDVQADKAKDTRIVIGTSVCSEIELPELKEQETYWSVDTKGKEIIISGSTPSALEAAVEYFLSQCSYDKDRNTFSVAANLEEETYTNGYYRDGWLLLDIPAYWGDNELVATTYDCGLTLIDDNKNDGTCLLQTVKSTTKEEAEAYAKLLEANGYEQISKRTVENNEFYRYKNETTKISVNFFGNEEEADIIMDQSTIATNDISYTYEPKAGERTEVYLYALYRRPYDDASLNDSIAIRGGLSMVIKCADNSVIIIDGGESATQFRDEHYQDYLDFLHEITGTPAGEKIRISAWHVTHGHGDHANGMAAFLIKNVNNVILERVITNLPDEKNVATATEVVGNIRTAVQTYRCPEIKVHTGDVIQIADVTMEILYTHEDLATDAGIWGSTDDNDASIASRFVTSDGMTFFLNGDMNMTSYEAMAKNFSSETLNTTLALVSHHLYNDMAESYFATLNPQYFLVGADSYNIPNTSVTKRQHEYAAKYSEGVYYEDDTYGFAYENGRAVVCYHKEMY